MPIYRIEERRVILAYAPPGKMTRRLAARLMSDADRDGGDVKEGPAWRESTDLPNGWEARSLLYQEDGDDLYFDEAKKLP